MHGVRTEERKEEHMLNFPTQCNSFAAKFEIVTVAYSRKTTKEGEVRGPEQAGTGHFVLTDKLNTACNS